MQKLAFCEAVARNISIAGVLRDLDQASVGSNYRLVKREVSHLGLDTSHWKGQAHGLTICSHKKPLSHYLKKDGPKIGARIKKRLIREGILEDQCKLCERPPIWEGKPLVLRLDHINGVRNDNRVVNLRLLCPNCDSQTSTYCGRNRKITHRCTCGQTKARESTKCLQCENKRRLGQHAKITWPTTEALKLEIGLTSYSAVGQRLGVSDSAVRKRIKKHSASLV